MKLIPVLGLFIASVTCSAKTTQKEFNNTTKFAGSYSVGDVENGARTRFIIYPETDSTVLFFVDVCKGGSASISQLYGRALLKNGQGIYTSKKIGDKKSCKFKMTFENDTLTIKTLDACYSCGLGPDIHLDSRYERKINVVPAYFTNAEGRKVYFDKTSPEGYSK